MGKVRRLVAVQFLLGEYLFHGGAMAAGHVMAVRGEAIAHEPEIVYHVYNGLVVQTAVQRALDKYTDTL